jgi:hypothetical protein
MVEIVLPTFDNTLTPIAATAIDNAVSEGTVEIEVDLEDFRQAFQIQTGNTVSPDNEDWVSTIQYFFDKSQLEESSYSFYGTPALNPAFGKVVLNPATLVDASGTALSVDNMALVNDYMRDLSAQIFGNPQLIYLFTNARVVQRNIVQKFKGTVVKGITDILNLVDVNTSKTENYRLVGDNSGNNFMIDAPLEYPNGTVLNATQKAAWNQSNICRTMLLSILEQAPSRFRSTDSPLSFVTKAPVPFHADDSILFRVILDNADQMSPEAQRGGQSNLPTGNLATNNAGWTLGGQVRNRVYNIRLILKSTPSNPGIDTLSASSSIYYDLL